MRSHKGFCTFAGIVPNYTTVVASGSASSERPSETIPHSWSKKGEIDETLAAGLREVGLQRIPLSNMQVSGHKTFLVPGPSIGLFVMLFLFFLSSFFVEELGHLGKIWAFTLPFFKKFQFFDESPTFGLCCHHDENPLVQDGNSVFQPSKYLFSLLLGRSAILIINLYN